MKIKFIGNGLCGSKQALVDCAEFKGDAHSDVLLTNVSKVELESVGRGIVNDKHLLHIKSDTDKDGSDKDVTLAKSSFVNSINDTIDTICEFVSGADLVFIRHSLSGGSGAGVSPAMFSILHVDEIWNVRPGFKRPGLIVGVGTLGGKNEGIRYLENIIKSASWINGLIEKNICHYMLVENQYAMQFKELSKVEQWDKLNADSSKLLAEYFTRTDSDTGKGYIDIADRMGAMGTNGISWIGKLESDGSVISPFLSPQKIPMKTLLANIPLKDAKVYEDHIGVKFRPYDSKFGYVNDEEISIEPENGVYGAMISTHGLEDLDTLLIPYRDNFDTYQESMAADKKTRTSNGQTALKDRAGMRSYINENYKTSKLNVSSNIQAADVIGDESKGSINKSTSAIAAKISSMFDD